MMRSDGQRLRTEIVRVGRLMYEKGFIAASDGNISARLDERRLLITPSGLHKGMMEPDQLLVVDYDGHKIGPSTAANRKLEPTSEMPMHLEAFRQRPDIQAVVHAHPAITVALSIAGVPLSECLLPEVIVFLGIIPTTAYATPSSEENVAAIRQLIRDHDALVLQRHGSLTVGDSPMQAFMRLETVEQNSRIAFMLRQLGASHPLPAAEVRKLLRQRQEMGLSRPGELAEFCEECGVCHLGDEHPPTLRPGAVTAPRGTAGSPQNLPPISAPAMDQEAVRRLVAQVVRQTMGE